MKETQPYHKDKIENVRQVKIEKKRIGSLVPHEGHTCFEFNTKTFELRKAKYSNKFVMITGTTESLTKTPNHLTVDTKEDCYYLCALNAKNAARKISKKFRVPFVKEIIE